MDTYPLHASAVVLPVFSAIALALDIAPFVWHVRGRNVGAASLIFWITLLLLMNIVNPIIWPRDNFADWWIGHGLCDIEIRLQLGASVGCPAAASCILRRLAQVLDTKRITVKTGASDKRRQTVMDLLICFGAPVAVMISYYAVHVNRYDLFAITGCSWPIDDSWVSIALVLIWPVIFCVFCVYYAGQFTLTTKAQAILTGRSQFGWSSGSTDIVETSHAF
jgi:pheromone a factor receptor